MAGAVTPGVNWDLLSVGLGSPRDLGSGLGLVGGAGTLQCGTGVSRAGGTCLGDSHGMGEGSCHYGAESSQCGTGRPRSGNRTSRIRVWG